jgi:hypothetical protein
MLSFLGSGKRKNQPEVRSLPRRGFKKLEKKVAAAEMQDHLMQAGEIGTWLVGSAIDSMGFFDNLLLIVCILSFFRTFWKSPDYRLFQ